jgi:glycine cleavage system H protein
MAAKKENSPAANEPVRHLGTVPTGNQECIWMRAGVLSYRLCDRNLDCEHCLLDAGLLGRGPGALAPWTPGDWGPSGYRLFPHDRRFSAGHTWVLPLDKVSARVGVDALIAWLVTDVTAVKLPAVDTWLERGEVAVTLLAKGGKLTIPTPVSGRVLACNELASSCPELVTAAPYGAGWLVDLALAPDRQRKQMGQLLCGPDMETLSRGHLHHFHQRTDALTSARPARLGATMADGGQTLADPRAILGSPRYLKLVQELLT